MKGPAAPIEEKVFQPDGSAIIVRTVGDEFSNWVESVSGHPIDRDNQGVWKYIICNEGKISVLSKHPAHMPPPQYIRKSPEQCEIILLKVD